MASHRQQDRDDQQGVEEQVADVDDRRRRVRESRHGPRVGEEKVVGRGCGVGAHRQRGEDHRGAPADATNTRPADDGRQPQRGDRESRRLVGEVAHHDQAHGVHRDDDHHDTHEHRLTGGRSEVDSSRRGLRRRGVDHRLDVAGVASVELRCGRIGGHGVAGLVRGVVSSTLSPLVSPRSRCGTNCRHHFAEAAISWKDRASGRVADLGPGAIRWPAVGTGVERPGFTLLAIADPILYII